jgi:hypothetical protein
MPTPTDLVAIADGSTFIFTASIARTGASTVATVPISHTTVVVSVEHVIKAPLGLRLSGRDVTVQLLHPLSAGRYVFFADPQAIGGGIAVKERAHLDGTDNAQREAEAAVARAYEIHMARRLEPAFLVVLGMIGAVRPLFTPAEQRGRVPWAVAPLEIERVLKGKEHKGKDKLRRVTLIGPVRASKRLPQAPALRAGLHAIFILHRPPQEAIDLMPEDERPGAAYLASVSDIQPPDRLADIVQIVSRSE